MRISADADPDAELRYTSSTDTNISADTDTKNLPLADTDILHCRYFRYRYFFYYLNSFYKNLNEQIKTRSTY